MKQNHPFFVSPNAAVECGFASVGKNGAIEAVARPKPSFYALREHADAYGVSVNENGTFSHKGALSRAGGAVHDGLVKLGWRRARA